jgi:hypothetical protein
MFNTWRKRRNCMHQEMAKSVYDESEQNTVWITHSWIRSVLIDIGMKKMFWCKECGKSWFR